MASQWYSLVSQKLYLAQVLLRQQAPLDSHEVLPAVVSEANSQAVAELLIRARNLLLTMVARLHQKKSANPKSLAELSALFEYDVQDISALQALADQPDSWWSRLEQIDRALGQPPATRKTVSDENIIAIATETGPDRSAEALEHIRAAMAAFARDLEERHSEW